MKPKKLLDCKDESKALWARRLLSSLFQKPELGPGPLDERPQKRLVQLAESHHRHFDQPERNIRNHRRQGDDDEHADKIAGPSRERSQEREDQVAERNMIKIIAIGNAAKEIQYAT